ncbi:phage tail protein [Komagataeibacter kakiaceti]|uniref:phage tail protein n=1 Tax=Komagataeibacter kakiaceti TaxID=943261 RepID=UPI0019008AA1
MGCLTFWPSSTPPSGWLILNGASFSTTTYPVLAARFPSGVLPICAENLSVPGMMEPVSTRQPGVRCCRSSRTPCRK